MGSTSRPSSPALAVVGNSLASHRQRLIDAWSDWITARVSGAPFIDRATTVRHLTLLVDIIIEATGPLRRHVAEVWFNACDTYGRTAAARGLAAGEVVEELQYLRELLIHEVADVVATLTARQSLTVVLRLNRVLDRGISHAVVGYTDVLVETLLHHRGVVLDASTPGESGVLERLDQLEEELAMLRQQRERGQRER